MCSWERNSNANSFRVSQTHQTCIITIYSSYFPLFKKKSSLLIFSSFAHFHLPLFPLSLASLSHILGWLIIIVSWDPEGHYHLFNSVPLRTRRALSPFKVYGISALLVLNRTMPFWFSTEHHWIVIMPFWFSGNNIDTKLWNRYNQALCLY